MRVVVDELRRLYDAITSSFDHLRTKALGLLAGEIAIVTFLFAAKPSDNGFDILIVSNFIFFFVGVVLMSASCILLISVLASSSWSHPPDTRDTRKMEKRIGSTELDVLLYLKEDYEEVVAICARIISKRAERFMWAVYMFILAAFILVVLKYGGGGITL